MDIHRHLRVSRLPLPLPPRKSDLDTSSLKNQWRSPSVLLLHGAAGRHPPDRRVLLNVLPRQLELPSELLGRPHRCNRGSHPCLLPPRHLLPGAIRTTDKNTSQRENNEKQSAALTSRPCSFKKPGYRKRSARRTERESHRRIGTDSSTANKKSCLGGEKKRLARTRGKTAEIHLAGMEDK